MSVRFFDDTGWPGLSDHPEPPPTYRRILTGWFRELFPDADGVYTWHYLEEISALQGALCGLGQNQLKAHDGSHSVVLDPARAPFAGAQQVPANARTCDECHTIRTALTSVPGLRDALVALNGRVWTRTSFAGAHWRTPDGPFHNRREPVATTGIYTRARGMWHLIWTPGQPTPTCSETEWRKANGI